MHLPTFIIGGVRRGGSSSLYHAIRQHPEIFLYPHSELNYFVEKAVNGRKWRATPADPDDWETSHSIEDYAKLFADGTQARAIGHKGADLLFWSPAHARMARFIPKARFIFTLRNPVKRAWSHYGIECAKGRETLSFEKALALEDERARKSDWARFHLSYRARGFYDVQLKRFFKIFPSERVLVITLEQTITHPRKTLQQVYRFLGVNPELGLDAAGTRKKQSWATVRRPWTLQKGIRQLVDGYEVATNAITKILIRPKESRRLIRNKLQRPFRKPIQQVPMPEACQVELNNIYAPHIAALESLLNRPFEAWKH
jgi:hypothetical protein